MPESQKSPALIAEVKAAHRITSPTQLREIGWGDSQLGIMALQTSNLIADYNAGHNFELLPKTPEQIISQFESGHSVFIASNNNGEPSVLYHGTIYPNLDPAQQKATGVQVVEIGSTITAPAYRNGLGLGTEGNRLRLRMAVDCSPYPDISLATNKQMLTTRVWQSADRRMQPVDYHRFPHISFLTCTCENSSEACGHISCEFRRPSHLATRSEFELTVLNRQIPATKMPCTLVISDPDLADTFESRCRTLGQQLLGKQLEPGHIDQSTMTFARSLFAAISEEFK